MAHGIKADATLRLGLGSAAALLAWRGTLDLLGLGHLGPSHRGVGDAVTSEDRKATFSSKIVSAPGSSIGQVAYDGRTRLRDTRSLAGAAKSTSMMQPFLPRHILWSPRVFDSPVNSETELSLITVKRRTAPSARAKARVTSFPSFAASLYSLPHSCRGNRASL